MDNKLRQLMKHEGINSTRLAEILGIQASGISHIMSGRNKPSFDFLLKLLQRFPQINPDWLLLDKGPMYRNEIKGKTTGSVNTSGSTGYASTVNTKGDVNFQARPGIVGDINAPYDVAGAGNLGPMDAIQDLFGPDNTDIITSAGQPGAGKDPFGGRQDPSGGGKSHTESQQSHLSGVQDHTSGQMGGQMGGTPRQIPRQTPRQAPQEVPQQPVYQSSVGFTKSAMIERIVVFYKDKTFSEYQPG
jgi:DNA-binding XRE family transcriptional regulator